MHRSLPHLPRPAERAQPSEETHGRRILSLTKNPSSTPNPPASEADDGFAVFALSQPVLRALEELGYEAPTPIQRATIRFMLEGRDVIAQAQTGTGKTAFGIPMMERIDVKERVPQTLVLAPTRELAVQDADALYQIGRYRNVQVLPIYGGAPYERQLRALRDGVHVVVGTPGRMLDHFRRAP